MRSITKQLDMSPGAISPVVHVSQYDSDFSIVFNLYCTDGTFTLESGTTAEVRGTKKSGTGYSATATVNISAKTVTVTGHKQMTAVAGDNIYEITLYKGSKELNSINFILAVERAAMDQDTVVDETTIREFGELKTYIEGVKADTAASASAANASKNAAAASAQESAQSAIEAAQSAQSVDAERLNRIAFGSYVVEESTGPIAHFEDGADDIPMKDVLVHIEPVQAGSGDPSLTNVRAISGWTAAKVSRCGKNLLPYPYADTTKEINGITFTDNGDGTITANGTSTASAQFVLTGAIKNKEVVGCTLSGAPGISGTRINAQVYGEPWTQFARDDGHGIVIPDSGYKNIRFIIQINTGITINNVVFRPMLRAPSDTDGTYTPPVSQDVYNIAFPSSAGTIYGGTLDVTSGVLTVDRAIITLSDVSQLGTGTISGSGYYVGIKGSNIAKYVSAEATVISDKMIGVSSSNDASAANREKFRVNVASNKFLIIHAPASSGISNNNDLFSAIGMTNFVFELATPQTYQLTPQEITSLLGQNNLWADCGDTEVEYRADTTLYIGRLTEPDADMIADSNITSGQYFMVGNSLYRATSNIASGASVIVGTNAVKVSLATALNEINQ